MHKQAFISILLSLCLISCAGELEQETALNAIASQKELSSPFYAPLHLAPEVLTGENLENRQAYIERRYGSLIKQGLIEAKIGDGNSWRMILRLSLTDKGRAMMDENRSTNDTYYVQVCRMSADSILELKPITSDTVVCKYRITQKELTPFGMFLGFVENQQHFHERKFVKKTFSWDMAEI